MEGRQQRAKMTLLEFSGIMADPQGFTTRGIGFNKAYKIRF